MLDPSHITEQADQLIASYQALFIRSQHQDMSDLPDWETEELAARLYAAIERSVPPTSSYFEQAKIASEHQPIHLRNPILLGILRAIKADIEAGWLLSVVEVLHAETFSDFLDQSTELLDKGYKDAAAVLAGAVLESHLRLLCGKHGLSTFQPTGAAKKATVLNSDLVKSGEYTKVQQKAIEAWQGIRNAAAHGDFSLYDELGVRNFLSGLEGFIATHPA